MLKRLTVENYRSLERVQVALQPLTAFVGANGSGKSSLLRAIDLVLGQRYPSVGSLRFHTTSPLPMISGSSESPSVSWSHGAMSTW